MKVFQIVNGICHWDATSVHPTIQSTYGKYSIDTLFVEAPDFVFEGWGYQDGNFIQPTPPPGWLYDPNTGTFYPEDSEPPKRKPTIEEYLVELDYRVSLIELGVI